MHTLQEWKDLSIAERAEQALISCYYRFATCVRCDFQDGVLVLTGNVPSTYLKQLALSHVATIDGVDRIENRIAVHATT